MHRLQGEARLRPPHLVRRFFEVLLARPLSPRDQAEVAALLRPAERELFWDQPVADQRHGLAAARRAAPHGTAAVRAALLHDVGKRHARLGAFGRTAATVARALGWTRPRRVAAYVRHGPVGAAELERAGAEELVVLFARHHTARRPDSVDPDLWAALVAADRG